MTYSGNKFKCHNASNIPFHDVDKVHLLATHAFKNHDTFSTWLSNNKLRSEQKTVSKADKEWRSKYVRAKDVFSKYSNLNTDEKINFLTVLETKCISVQDSSRSLDVFNRQL